MLILRGLGAVVLLLPALALGAFWVRAAWRTRDAFTCWSLGPVVGLSAHLAGLNLLCHLVRPLSAGLVLTVAELAVLLVAAGRFYRASSTPEMPAAANAGRAREPSAAVWRSLGVFRWVLLVIVALWVFQAIHLGPTDPVVHSAVSGVLARRGLPSPNPCDPAQVLVYHYGLDLLSATLGEMTGLRPWQALHLWTAWLALWLAIMACEFLRAAAERAGEKPSGLELGLGLTVFLLGGGLAWVNWVLDRPGLVTVFETGFAWDGLSSLFRLPAVASGWVWWLALWTALLRWPRTAPGRSRAGSPSVPFGVLLGVLPLLAEHVALVLGVVFVILTIHRLVRGADSSLCPPDLAGWLAAGALGLGLGVFGGGAWTAA